MKRKKCFEVYLTQRVGKTIYGAKIFICSTTEKGASRKAIRLAKQLGWYDGDTKNPINVSTISLMGYVWL